jgi:AcrR family transcriptional regulator
MVQPPDRRQRARQATIEEIKAIARQQMAEDGASSLSMGAIARAMGVTPPALYRYFESRDALVAALVVDAYDSMAEALEASVATLPEEDFVGRFFTMIYGYREWALAHSGDYDLMYSTPVSGPEQAIAQMSRSIMRSLGVIVQLLRTAHEANRLVIPQQYYDPPSSVRQALAWMRSTLQDEVLPLGILALSLTIWIQAHNLVWQEMHGPLPARLFGAGELYDMEARVLAERLGLTRS